MDRLRTILLAVDPRMPVTPRIRYCAEMACLTNSELGLLHIMEAGSTDYWRGIETVQAQIDQSPIDPFRTWSVSLPGKPAKAIPDFAASVQAGLVVLTSRRRRAFSRMLLGSTSMTVGRTAKCPVLLCSDDDNATGAGFRCRRIICVVVFNRRSRDYIRYIGSFAKVLGATLTLVHILPEVHEGQLASAAYAEDEFVMTAGDALDRLAGLADEVSVPCDITIRRGDPASLIRKEVGTRLDCMIATGNNRTGCHTVVEELAGTVAVPVLTIPYSFAEASMKSREQDLGHSRLSIVRSA